MFTTALTTRLGEHREADKSWTAAGHTGPLAARSPTSWIRACSIVAMALLANSAMADVIIVNGIPIVVWDTRVRSNRPIVKRVRRSTQEDSDQVIEICEHLSDAYTELLANRIWEDHLGRTVRADLLVHNPNWIRLEHKGKTTEVPNDQLSENSRDIVKRLNDLRDVRRAYRRNKGQIQNRLVSAVDGMRQLIVERFGDLDALQIELIVSNLINRASIAEYQALVNEVTIRMTVAAHFAAIITEQTNRPVTAEELNRRLMALGSQTFVPRRKTKSIRVVTNGLDQTITESIGRYVTTVDVNRVTIGEYVDAVIELMNDGAGEAPQLLHNKTNLPAPILE